MNKLIRFITDKNMRTLFWNSKGFYKHLDDEKYLKKVFEARLGYPLNLDNPQTFNEKMQWLKLYDRKPEYTTMVDKFEVKKYVSSIIGEEYIIPTLGVWNEFEDIDFESLPNQFVLKCTHDSGGLAICRDKSKFNYSKSKEILDKYMKRDFYMVWREWPYKNVKHRIIAEKYMEDESGGLRDYKFFCFDGEPLFLYISKGLENHETATIDFYDMNYNRMPFKRTDYKGSEVDVPKPAKYNEMIEIAKKLSKDIPFVRIDLYEINGKVYFSEITFCPCAGCLPFDPPEWDLKLGKYVNLPNRV